MLLAVPLEDLGCVFLANGTTFKRILLKEQVEGLITAAVFSHMKELVVVPVLAEYSLRPCRLPLEKLDNILCTALTHERPEEYNSVRAQIHLTVEAPLVVRILQHLLQVSRQLRVHDQLTRSESNYGACWLLIGGVLLFFELLLLFLFFLRL